MSEIGDILDGAEAHFERLEDTLTIRNFVDAEGGDDKWGDPTGGTSQAGTRVEHPDSPQQMNGAIDLRGRPSVEAEFSGLDVEADAVGYIDTAAYVTDGGGTWNGEETPYPTEVTDAQGAQWTIVHVFQTGTGRVRVLCRSENES